MRSPVSNPGSSIRAGILTKGNIMDKPRISELRLIGQWPGMAQYLIDDKTKTVWAWNRCTGGLSNCGDEQKFRAIFKDHYRGELFA